MTRYRPSPSPTKYLKQHDILTWALSLKSALQKNRILLKWGKDLRSSGESSGGFTCTLCAPYTMFRSAGEVRRCHSNQILGPASLAGSRHMCYTWLMTTELAWGVIEPYLSRPGSSPPTDPTPNPQVLYASTWSGTVISCFSIPQHSKSQTLRPTKQCAR